MKNIKRIWYPCYDLFKYGASGFGWNHATEMFTAEPEVWQRLIEVKPEAAEWKNKQMRNFHKLCLLFAKDRADGLLAETAAEMRKRKNAFNEESEVYTSLDNIDDLDSILESDVNVENPFTSQQSGHRNTAQGVPTQNEEETVRSHSISHDKASSKGKAKKKKAKVDGEVVLLKEGLDNVAQAITTSTSELVKATTLPISESEVWNLLVDLNIAAEHRNACYLFLVQKPDMLRALLGCPVESRSSLLHDMMA
ncbi:unnamed protein product [Cuscuta epithymum]|uniref:Myb/SANT-like domain-containing protein n=1 Tax=Cuscuta epithymum TaxID=186058 RepID=A0AAV0GIH8_9ASTE|nr:unnamed protein product [Cuscuta epithymum]